MRAYFERMRAQDFRVNIIGLSQKAHRFEYSFGDEFFELYGRTLLEHGRFTATVTLDKSETMLECRFQITGTAGLICDRSLEPFDHPMDIDKMIVFKYGAEEQELSEEIVVISRDRAQLDLGQYLYELIAVAVPMKKLHPKFAGEHEESDVQLVYSSPIESNDEEDEKPIDPRWEKLKKLK
ncbi:MAG: DUF177 domain-containing protein [Cyclobacteriaceae bacterium]|nr:DUF177 domain-containing protein [Cyclobacteriaceae bacterium]